MSDIDLGNNPTSGTSPTSDEKEQIRAALGLSDFASKSASETLTNKTLNTTSFSGNTYGQLELRDQQQLSGFSAVTRNHLRREMVGLGNNIQDFNLHRPLWTRGGLNSINLRADDSNTFVDTLGTIGYNMSFDAQIDHTTWGQYDLGICWMNSSSGGSFAWDFPHSFAFRVNHVLFRTTSLGIYHIGPSGSTQGGVPIGKGWGLCLSKEGYRLWAHDGTQWSATGSASTNTITANGHNFVDGDIIQFTGALTGGLPLKNSTRYYVINVSGNNFQLSNTLGGAAIEFQTNITSAKIPKLPTYSLPLAGGVPSITDGYQSNSNFLFVSNGLGIGSVFYGAFNVPPSYTPIGTIAIPTTGSNTTSMKFTMTSTGTYIPYPANGNNQTIAVLTSANFAPFGV